MNKHEFAENWLNALVTASRPVFSERGYTIPDNLRVRIGLPSTGYRSKALAEYFPPELSGDGHHEIYVSPKVAEGDARIADLVTHELLHGAVGAEHGHDRTFHAACKALGLEGKATATVAGPGWFAWAAPILAELGPMDFAALSANLKPAKKKKTYLHPIECPDCGWMAQITKKHVLGHDFLNCPVPDCDGTLHYVGAEDEDESE